MAPTHSFNLGHFLHLSHIRKGIALLKLQVEQKGYNFRNLDLEIYRKERWLKYLKPKQYFYDYIRQDSFYNYPILFSNTEYQTPKGIYGTRGVHFTSFHLQVLYYSIGLYLLELISPSLAEIETAKKRAGYCHTYYGGRIDPDKPEHSKVYYQDDYRAFTAGIKQSIRQGLGLGHDVVVIQQDIKDYYGSLAHDRLFATFATYSLPSQIKSKRFTADSVRALLTAFRFLMGNSRGLPLTPQNIISNFLSYIYLFPLDSFVHTLKAESTLPFTYHRYVDDFFLIQCVEKDTAKDTLGKNMIMLESRVATFLQDTLGLSLNALKSDRRVITNEKELEEFLQERKFISFEDVSFEMVPGKPQAKLDEIADILTEMQEGFMLTGVARLSPSSANVLNEVFVKTMKNFVKKGSSVVTLDALFGQWEPLLTLSSVKAIMFMLGQSNQGRTLIESYLKKELRHGRDKAAYLLLLERYLLLDKPAPSLVGRVRKSPPKGGVYFSLIQRMVGVKYRVRPGARVTPELPIPLRMLNDESPSLAQQVKAMVIAERSKNFNLAFNHLLNCFHFYLYAEDPLRGAVKLKDYDRNAVIRLMSKRASIEDIQFAMSVFDRRNKNTISHPGEQGQENWAVDQEEYSFYKAGVIKLMMSGMSSQRYRNQVDVRV